MEFDITDEKHKLLRVLCFKNLKKLNKDTMYFQKENTALKAVDNVLKLSKIVLYFQKEKKKTLDDVLESSQKNNSVLYITRTIFKTFKSKREKRIWVRFIKEIS